MYRKALINPDTAETVKTALAKNNFEVFEVPLSDSLNRAVAGHPDLQLFVHNDKIFCRQQMPAGFIKLLEKTGANIILCKSEPKDKYPDDIPYNIACAGSAAFHRTDKTDTRILEYLKESGIPVYNVAQGYTRCSTLIAGSGRIITADKGIYNAACGANIKALLIQSGYVELSSYKYGFLGGASGTYEDSVFFTGNINLHPDRKQIEEFIEEGGKKIICLSNDALLDIGSILFF